MAASFQSIVNIFHPSALHSNLYVPSYFGVKQRQRCQYSLYQLLSSYIIINDLQQFKTQMTELSVQLRHAKRSNKKQLSLARRELSFIPKDVFTIKTLEELDLSDNKITAIQPNICQLVRLKTINLQNNLLQDLPEEIMQLDKLTVLLIKGNPLGKPFQSLINLNFEDNVHNALYLCFEKLSPSKVRENQKGRETPSWLMQSEYSNKQEKKQQINRRKISKIEVNLQAEQERQSINGVLLLKTSDLSIGQQVLREGNNVISKAKHFDLQVLIKRPIITNENSVNQYKNQIQILAKYRHPNIVLMVGAISIPKQLCIALQMVKEGTLFTLIHKRRVILSEADKKRIAIQLISAVYYLHRVGMIHMNLNSKEVLVDMYYNAKLCGFGYAKHRSKINQQVPFIASPSYSAPQLLERKIVTDSVDVFALGTLLYQLYAGEIPYYGLDMGRIKEKLSKDSLLPYKISVKKSVMEIVNQCRAYQLKDRPKIAQLWKFNDW